MIKDDGAAYMMDGQLLLVVVTASNMFYVFVNFGWVNGFL